MRNYKLGLCTISSGLLFGCAHTPSTELVSARQTYNEARGGQAATLAPAQLDDARKALDRAEKAFADHPGDQETKDLAYIAQRQALLAQVRARVQAGENAKQMAEQQKKVQTQDELARTREQLAQTEKSSAATAQQLEAERQAREAAEKNAADSKRAFEDLSKVASVKHEDRGTVISLPGGVLFASGKSELLAGAKSRLDQVAKALKIKTDQTIQVEGHTDSTGSAATNEALGQRRADAVKQYLTSCGVDANRIEALGIGPARPVAPNTTAEGRAANRRVEIVIAPEPQS